MNLKMVQEQETIFAGRVPTNNVCLWVFPTEDGREWCVELEGEESSIILRIFSKANFKADAIWYAKKTARILGIEAMECNPRGM